MASYDMSTFDLAVGSLLKQVKMANELKLAQKEMAKWWSLFVYFLFIFLSLLPPNSPPERHAGPIRTTLPSGRPAWTSSPAGLAACPWCTPKWDWTRSCSKTRSPSFARNTGRLRGSDKTGAPCRPTGQLQGVLRDYFERRTTYRTR